MLAGGCRSLVRRVLPLAIGALGVFGCGGPAPQPDQPSASPTPSTSPWEGQTGPRVPTDQLRRTHRLETKHDGQVIEKVAVDRQIVVRHSNVVIRDVQIVANSPTSGGYPITIEPSCDDCRPPENILIEYVEIAGTRQLDPSIPAVFAPYGNWTLRHADIHGMGSGPRLTTKTRVENSVIHDMADRDPSEHKSGVGLNGGAHNAVVGNRIDCDVPGCSAALAMYGSDAPVDDVLVQGNLFNTTGSYCVYGGSVSSKDFPEGTNIRIVDNVFGTEFSPKCGKYGPIASWDPMLPGNVWQGNVWQDSGEPVVPGAPES